MTPGLSEHRFIHLTQYSLLRAFVQNADIMVVDLTTFHDEDSLSPWSLTNPYPAIAPHSLTPTLLQLHRPHHPYLDIIAPPTLRDSILLANLSDEDDDELCNGIHTDSFIVWGSQPWNSSGILIIFPRNALPSLIQFQ